MAASRPLTEFEIGCDGAVRLVDRGSYPEGAKLEVTGYTENGDGTATVHVVYSWAERDGSITLQEATYTDVPVAQNCEEDAPPTTTTPPTTRPNVPVTTVPGSPPPTVVTLPATGQGSGPLAVGGSLVLAAGLAFAYIGRRRATR